MEKVCTCCGEMKPASEYSKTDGSGRLRGACKKCDYKREKIRKLEKIAQGEAMKEAQFKAIYNGLSMQHKKVYESVPIGTYWSASRIGSELFQRGIKQDLSSVTGLLNCLVRSGIVIEADKGMFSRERVSASEKQKQVVKQPQEIKPMAKEPQKQNPFDALREVAIEFMDIAKKVNELAAKMDSRLAAAEKHIDTNDKDTEKLKQLQVLLKSLG